MRTYQDEVLTKEQSAAIVIITDRTRDSERMARKREKKRKRERERGRK